MASKKELQALIVLAGKVDPSLKKAMLNTQKNTRKTSSSFKKLAKIASIAGGIMAAAFSIRAAKNFGDESVDAAKKQIEAETKLQAVLKNVKSLQDQGPLAYLQAKKELVGVASQLQKVGVIGDEVSIAGFQQLATFQLNGKQIEKLSTGMTDLLAQQKGLNATQEDAVNISNMIGKAMDGQVGSLSRVGISFTDAQAKAIKLGDANQRAAVIAEVLQQNVGGVNKALAKTDQGQIQQMTNAWGDMKEEIGKKILPLQAKFAGWFMDKIPKIQKILTDMIDKFSGKFEAALPTIIRLTKNVGKGILFIYGAGKKVYQFISGNWSVIAPLIIGIVSAMVAWKAITIGMAIYKGIMAGIRAGTIAATIAQWGLNAAVLANPMTWIVLGIAAAIGVLVAGIYVLYKNWDKVQAFLVNTWIKVKHGFAVGINWIVDKLNYLIEKMNKIPGVEIPLIPKMDTSAYDAASKAQSHGSLQKFATGGIATRPSIFGDAGPEMAIPLKKTPRSLSLLKMTAEKLGFDLSSGKKGGNTFVFAPNYGNQLPSKQRMQEDFEEFKRKVKQVLDDDRRESFA